jgi:hypothetical protein
MEATPTLHDFVLNLLTDSTARAAFDLDPEGALNDAGLGDITAADVQEVIPLVVDYVPVDGITGLVGAGDLTAGGVTDLDMTGAVGSLQAITAQLPLSVVSPTADVNATAASAVTVGSGGLLGEPLLPVAGLDLGGFHDGGLLGGGIATLPAGLGVGANGGLSVDNDPDLGLDAGIVAPVGQLTGDVTGAVTGDGAVIDSTVGGTLDVAVNTVGDVTATVGLDPLLDDTGILPATSSVVGSVVGPEGIVGGAVDVDATVHGVGSTVASVGGTVEGVGGLVGGLGKPADAGAEHGGVVDGVTDLLF